MPQVDEKKQKMLGNMASASKNSSFLSGPIIV